MNALIIGADEPFLLNLFKMNYTNRANFKEGSVIHIFLFEIQYDPFRGGTSWNNVTKARCDFQSLRSYFTEGRVKKKSIAHFKRPTSQQHSVSTYWTNICIPLWDLPRVFLFNQQLKALHLKTLWLVKTRRPLTGHYKYINFIKPHCHHR